jgi:hypothetical protein
MKMADILRNVADLIDQQGGEEQDGAGNMEKSAADFQHDVTDGADSGDQEVNLTGVMIPPLQQKLEILKKTAGMDNAYDDQGSDELDDIKKLTGVKAVIGNIASEDNDIVG